MKIALLADVHANVMALKAVLADLRGVDHIVCAGDVVGYYPDANEVCDLLKRIGAQVIRGNHDAYVTGTLEPIPDVASMARTAWTRRTLTSANYKWLARLDVEAQVSSTPGIIRVRHANPWDEEERLFPDSPRLAAIPIGHAEVLVLGHTHYPMLVRRGAGMIVNPGSVGQPRDWNPLASYAVLDSNGPTVEFRRVQYDVVGLQRRLTELGWPPTGISILSRSRTATTPPPIIGKS